jgi:acetate kinase
MIELEVNLFTIILDFVHEQKDGKGKRLVDSHSEFSGHKEAVKTMFTKAIEEQHLPTPDGLGHRLVHQGPKHTNMVKMDSV